MTPAAPDLEETLPKTRRASARASENGWSALIVAFSCDDPADRPSRHSLEGVDEVELGRTARRLAERDLLRGRLRLGLSDAWASSRHASLRREGDSHRLIDSGSRNGIRVDGRLVSEALLSDGSLIEVGHTLLQYRRYPGPTPSEPDFSPAAGDDAAFDTLSPSLERELDSAFHLARSSELPLLIQGESGSGKEVLAGALSRRSARGGPFVPVNCGAIVPGLVESELFGHVRGAFTGADVNHEGLIRSAHGGTLFLDEIGDLELGAQAALLRVIQEREVRPVGSTRAVPVDVRLLSATHRDLEDLVARGRFRDDLLARLSGFRVRLPPLRQRREDLGLLVASLLASLPERGEPLRFEPEAAVRLFRYDWPLNVRELSNALSAASVLCRDGAVGEQHLPAALREVAPPPKPREPSALGAEDRRRRDELDASFRRHRGNLSAVARETGKARTQIQRWAKRYGLNPRDYRE